MVAKPQTLFQFTLRCSYKLLQTCYEFEVDSFIPENFSASSEYGNTRLSCFMRKTADEDQENGSRVKQLENSLRRVFLYWNVNLNISSCKIRSDSTQTENASISCSDTTVYLDIFLVRPSPLISVLIVGGPTQFLKMMIEKIKIWYYSSPKF